MFIHPHMIFEGGIFILWTLLSSLVLANTRIRFSDCTKRLVRIDNPINRLVGIIPLLIWLVGGVLRHMFNVKSYLYIYIKYIQVINE